MRTKAILAVLTIFVLSAAGFLLVSHMLYLSHTAVVYDTVTNVIDRNNGALPQQAADLGRRPSSRRPPGPRSPTGAPRQWR